MHAESMLCTMCLFELKHIFKWGKTRAKETIKALVSIQTPSPGVPKELIILTSSVSIMITISLLTSAYVPSSQPRRSMQIIRMPLSTSWPPWGWKPCNPAPGKPNGLCLLFGSHLGFRVAVPPLPNSEAPDTH